MAASAMHADGGGTKEQGNTTHSNSSSDDDTRHRQEKSGNEGNEGREGKGGATDHCHQMPYLKATPTRRIKHSVAIAINGTLRSRIFVTVCVP